MRQVERFAGDGVFDDVRGLAGERRFDRLQVGPRAQSEHAVDGGAAVVVVLNHERGRSKVWNVSAVWVARPSPRGVVECSNAVQYHHALRRTLVVPPDAFVFLVRCSGTMPVADQRSRQRAYRRGHRGEWLAAAALMLKGFRIIARRYRTKLGEIDLIARRGNLVLIVEVKVRPTLMQAMEAIAY